MLCDCDSGDPFDACCGPLLEGRQPATTAAALMRSRYTAFVRGAVDYLLETYDPSTRDPKEREAIESWSRESKWLGLEIVATEGGAAGDPDGIVEFRARYRRGETVHVHHERSRFRKDDGRWYYVDGTPVKSRPATRAVTVGRNDACPCGSGKKFKKCCGGAAR